MSIFDLKNLFKNACQLELKNKFKMLLFIWVKMWYDVIIIILYLYTQYTGITYLISRFIFVFADLEFVVYREL